VAEARNVEEAEAVLKREPVDLLFLDIQMPGGSGFDLLERLDRMPLVIFTTAFDQYAIRAFEVNALDYLMKPVAPEASRRRSIGCGSVRAARRVGRWNVCSFARASGAGS
jgi:two-component system, LytTR family, response regulator